MVALISVQIDSMGEEKTSVNVGSSAPIDAINICHDI
jgi:WD repeat-containing protein 19